MNPEIYKSTNREVGGCMCCGNKRWKRVYNEPYTVHDIDIAGTTFQLCDEHLLELRREIICVAGTFKTHRKRVEG